MRSYLEASLDAAALPAGERSPELWLQAVDTWWPRAVRIGAQRVPPGLLFDLAAAVARRPVAWRCSRSSGDYADEVRQLAVACWRSGAPDGSPALPELTGLLTGLLCGAGNGAPPALPRPIDLPALAAVLRERAEGLAPKARADSADDWHGYIQEWQAWLAAHLGAARRSPASLELAVDDPDGASQLLSLELELLSGLRVDKLPRPSLPAARRKQSPGELRHRRPFGPGSAGIDGIERTDDLSRACPWQLALGRQFLADKLASRELSTYRPPRRTGQRQTTSCLIAWFDPTSVGTGRLVGQQELYASGKRLAGQSYLELLALAADMRIDNLRLGLCSLPASLPPSFITPESARRQGLRSEASPTGLELVSGLPALARFFSRPAHPLSIAETCAAADLLAYGVALVIGKSLIDALTSAERLPGRCVIMLLVPQALLPLLEPGSPTYDAAERLLVEIDELVRPLLSARVAVLALHDASGALQEVAVASSRTRDRLASPRGGGPASPGDLTQRILQELLAGGALQEAS